MISTTENSNKVLEGKISSGHGNTWMSTIQFNSKELWCAFSVIGKILQWDWGCDDTWANGTSHISLFMKEGCLFVLFILMRSTELGCFRSCFWSLWKSFKEERRGALAWFHGVWTCDVKVFEYWMISSLKIKWNLS
jgi:hypothetical protein